MRVSFNVGCAASLLLLAVLPLGWGKADGIIRDHTATVRGTMELITVNFVPDVDPQKLVGHIAAQLDGVSEAEITISGAAGSDIAAHTSLALGVEITVPTGASPAVKKALGAYFSRGGGRYSPPFLAELSGKNELPYPFVLSNLESETLMASQCATVMCDTVVTGCAADSVAPNLFRTDDECCLACISDAALGFHQDVGDSILGHATEVVTVSIDMELIPINDVPQANPGGLAGHVANVLLGVQESDVTIAMMGVQDLKSHERYAFSADIVAPGGSSAAVIARMEQYMSERPMNTIGIDDVGANMYSKPFLASIGQPDKFPFPFVLKYDGSSVNWDASDDCSECPATTACSEGSIATKPDLACCSVCETAEETAARRAAAAFILDNEGGRVWAYPVVEASLELIPINDVANVEVSRLESLIASNIGIAAEAVTIVKDPRETVNAHSRIAFTAFIEGPIGSLDAIVAAVIDDTSQQIGNVTTGIDFVSLPFLADLGAPNSFEAPYIIMRNSVTVRPPAYCAMSTCPEVAACGDGLTLSQTEGECCSSCKAESQADYLAELAEYELRHNIWTKAKGVYSADMAQWRRDSAEWLEKYSDCKP